MELGATVCRPRAPSCGACPVRAGCAGGRGRRRAAPRAAPPRALRGHRPLGARARSSPRWSPARRRRRWSRERAASGREAGLVRDGLVVRGATARCGCHRLRGEAARRAHDPRAGPRRGARRGCCRSCRRASTGTPARTGRLELAVYGDAPVARELEAAAGGALLATEEDEAPDDADERRLAAIERRRPIGGRIVVRPEGSRAGATG